MSLAHVASNADVLAGRHFNIDVPTNAPSQDPNNFGVATLQFQAQQFSNFGKLLADAKKDALLPEQWKKDGPIVWVYVKKTPDFKAVCNAIAEESQKQFEELYPGVKLRFRFQKIKEDAKAEATPKSDPTSADEETVDLKESRNPVEVNAQTAERIKLGVAVGRSLVLFVVRSMQIMPWALQYGGTPLVLAVGVLSFDVTAEFLLVKFGQKLQDLMTFQFHTPNERFNKGATAGLNAFLNMTLFAMGRPLLMQTLLHTVMPLDVTLPSQGDLMSVFYWSAAGTMIFGYFTQGFIRGRDKGVYSRAQVDVMLQPFGIIDSMGNVVGSIPELHPLRPFLFVPQWMGYIGLGTRGFRAKPNTSRIVVVDATLNPKDRTRFVEAEQATVEPFVVDSPEKYAEAAAWVNEKLAEAAKGTAANPEGKRSCPGDLGETATAQ